MALPVPGLDAASRITKVSSYHPRPNLRKHPFNDVRSVHKWRKKERREDRYKVVDTEPRPCNISYPLPRELGYYFGNSQGIAFCMLFMPSKQRTSENTPSRDCLESSWTGRIARLSVARSAEKGTLSPVVQAHGTMKWSLSGVSRQSLHALR